MLVYRMEDIHTGRGPYNPDYSKGDENYVKRTRDARDLVPSSHPGGSDFSWKVEPYHYFGFESIENLMFWFLLNSRFNIFHKLYELDFKVHIYEIDENQVIYGDSGNQLIFVKEKATLQSVMKLEELEIFKNV